MDHFIFWPRISSNQNFDGIKNIFFLELFRMALSTKLTSCRYFLYWILKWHAKLHYLHSFIFRSALSQRRWCWSSNFSIRRTYQTPNECFYGKYVQMYNKTREINYNFLFLKKSWNQLKNYFLRYGLEGKDEKWLKKIQRCIIQKFLNVWVPNGKFWPRSKKGHLLMRLKD